MPTSDWIGKTVTVRIDRPMGSHHPKHGFLYPVNYGFLPNIPGGDGEDLDAYVLGIQQPMDEFTGQCIAVIHRFDDQDDKLVVVPEEMNISDEGIRELTRFQEQFFKSVVIRS